ncbi:MAG: RNA methyltransferase [Bacteroidaceae bacterium]|nr:RNA methyltransferase [Bacteroidaceae bacterium]
MLTKATIKLIHSLDSRKGRRKEGLFVAEGPKLVGEMLGHFSLHALFATEEMILDACLSGADVVSSEDLARASLLQTPQGVLALFRIPEDSFSFSIETAVGRCMDGLVLALDGVQDPGNLGTIVRLADWFGVSDLLCSPDTCDIWNPKAVQATMGALAHVRVHTLPLSSLFSALPPDVPVYGTSLTGSPLWDASLSSYGLIVMGNEGRGISSETAACCNHQLLIPNYPEGRPTTDSLNVAMATGIVLAEFRRRCR